MSWHDLFVQKKAQSAENNYKIELFNKISSSNEIANMSTIKKYFNSLYDTNDTFSAFSVGQSLDDAYVAESTNKIARLNDYRNMTKFQEIGQSVDMMCYSADIPDENDKLINIKIDNDFLDSADIAKIKDAIQDYLNLFDFDNNFEEYFRIFLTEGQICWENIIAKDDLEEGIIRNQHHS